MENLDRRTGTFRFSVDVGVLIRKSVVAAIKEKAFLMGITCEINEIYRGWLQSSYTIKVAGEAYRLYRFRDWFTKMQKEMNAI